MHWQIHLPLKICQCQSRKKEEDHRRSGRGRCGRTAGAVVPPAARVSAPFTLSARLEKRENSSLGIGDYGHAAHAFHSHRRQVESASVLPSQVRCAVTV